MVPKGAIVSVLLDRHQLDTVVAGVDDPGQNLVGKFAVLRDSPVHTGHTNVRLVDSQASWLTLNSFVLVRVLGLWIPEYSIEKIFIVLNNVSSPSWVFVILKNY